MITTKKVKTSVFFVPMIFQIMIISGNESSGPARSNVRAGPLCISSFLNTSMIGISVSVAKQNTKAPQYYYMAILPYIGKKNIHISNYRIIEYTFLENNVNKKYNFFVNIIDESTNFGKIFLGTFYNLII